MSGARGEFLLGNDAIAKGALDGGMRFFSCYPGTPSSEVASALAGKAKENGSGEIFHEYSVNEKVALEAACGAALAGLPAMAAMKHVGLNVAADPLFTATYIGMPGGLVILSADDPGCHSSQNEQDNREYARFACMPCLEPATAQEAYDMAREAFGLARDLAQPVLLRTTTRISHLRAPVESAPSQDRPPVPFNPAGGRYVPVPAIARGRHSALAGQMKKAASMADASPFNRASGPENAKKGIIASGVARSYLRDAMAMSGREDDVAILELGMTWPLPPKTLEKFLEPLDEVLVLEEGAPLLERDVRAFASSMSKNISGKDADLTEFGEYSTSAVLNRISRWLGRKNPRSKPAAPRRDLPGRPPNLCPGCAHRAVYYAARKTFGDDAIYSSDIGCYTLGLLPPLRMADFLVCMGSSISAGSGFARASGKPVVAFIGDSTFFHSGMTGIANAIFNRHDLLIVVLDNGTTAMTGHQPNPGMSQSCLGDKAAHIDIESVAGGLGVSRIIKARSHNLGAMLKAFGELKEGPGVRLLIAEDPCVLYDRHIRKKKKNVVANVVAQGQEAEKCLAELACPAFVRRNGQVSVDENLCAGCMLCLQIAPASFKAKKTRS